MILTACGGGGTPAETTELLGIDRIVEYAKNGGTVPTLQDYQDAGVTGIDSEEKLAEINQVVEGLVAEDVDTVQEIQALANTVTIVVPTTDTTAPVITITGSNTATVIQNKSYTDAGATATDNVDGIVNVTSTGTVDTSTVGDYTITYTATDSAGNTATASRTVTVFTITHNDTTAPVITITGSNTATVIQNKSYTDAGATATDNVDGTVNVTSTGTVDTGTVGDYTITYTATDSAGNSATVIRTVTVEVSTITHNGTTYGKVTSPYTGKVWLDRNLGAEQVCTSSTDTACYGDYYQWGRDFDGHQDSQSSTTTTLATDVNNAGSSFVRSHDYINDWTTTDSNGSIRAANWSKTDGTSVCPVGFRVPTIAELQAETVDEDVTNRDTAFTNFLKFPSTGYRFHVDGSMHVQGSSSSVWSSSVKASSSRSVGFVSDNAFIGNGMRAYGFTVRCLRD